MSSRPGEAVLEVDRLGVSYPGRQVLQGVSFGLRAGEFCGLIGSNGSGKTTLLRAILGLQKIGAGKISIAGQKRGAVAYVPQKSVLDPEIPLRARDFIALGLDGHRLGLPLPNRARRARVAEMLQAVAAEEFADQRIGLLSGGQQQRVLIAHALIRAPRLLLLDEPLANLDLRSAAEMVSLLRKLARSAGVAVLISAHDMNPLLRAMDKIVYLANGRIASGTPAEVVRTDVLSRLYGYHIDVIKVHERILVVAGDAAVAADAHEPAAHVTMIP